MKEYSYAVYSNPVRGREAEYNHWYSEQHLADVMAVPGFISARRYRLVDPSAAGAPPQRYLAIYNMLTDDPQAALNELQTLVETGKVELSGAFSPDALVTVLYEAMTPVVTA